MDKADIDRLLELEAKATPGPWIDIHSADAAAPAPLQWQHHHEIRELDRAPSDKHSWPFRVCQTIEGQSAVQHDHDFAFIVAARNLVRPLAEQARRVPELEAEIARLVARLHRALGFMEGTALAIEISEEVQIKTVADNLRREAENIRFSRPADLKGAIARLERVIEGDAHEHSTDAA